MKKKFLPFLLLLLINESIGGPVKPTALSGCQITFTINNAGIDVTGTLEVVRLEIKFDPRSLNNSTILATADPSTIQTGIGIRDKHLKRRDYFDVEKFPEIRLVSKVFRKTGKNKFSGEFDLTIKDVTQTIFVPFGVRHDHEATFYHGTFEINRLDFKLGESSLILDEKVNVSIHVKVQ